MKNCDDVRALGIDANCCASCHCDDGYGYGSELMTEQFRGETYLVCCWVSDQMVLAGTTIPEEV